MRDDQSDSDEAERLGLASKWGFEARTVLSLMLLPGLLGAYLVIDGLTTGEYVEAGAGVLLVVATPVVARWVSRAIDPTPKRDL